MAIGSDHGGYELKEFIKQELTRRGIPVEDLGAHSVEPDDDYPDLVGSVAREVDKGVYERAIGICGAGIGASIAANRFSRVRAALCTSPDMARLSRQHNDANMLILGGRITSRDSALAILEAWLTAEFEGGRHTRRVEKLGHLRDS
ncbi:MAG: ribose 5-phosphate isomerase B [Chitinivibrionales bacterium]|nr:ribose 5-phosphate isomerase B [Chitinivibrionales bacterium]